MSDSQTPDKTMIELGHIIAEDEIGKERASRAVELIWWIIEDVVDTAVTLHGQEARSIWLDEGLSDRVLNKLTTLTKEKFKASMNDMVGNTWGDL